MKKILLGTSALVFAGMLSTAASAAELKMSVAGFSDWYVGYANQDSGIRNNQRGTYNDVDVMGNVEVHAKAEAVLENGMKAGAVVAFTGGTKAYDRDNNDSVKYSYAYLETAFGRTLIGLQDAVSKQMYVGAKDVGAFGINESHVVNFLAYDSDFIWASTYINSVDRSNMITYVTPNMNGLMLGVSYVPGSEATSNDNTVLRRPAWEAGATDPIAYAREAVIAAATYKMILDKGTTLTISGTAGTVATRVETAPPATIAINGRVWEYALNGQFAKNGLFIGGGYRKAEFEGNSGEDFKIWNASVGYENNKYGASLGYQGMRSGGLDAEMYLVSGKYKLSAGVDVFASFAVVNEDVEGATPQATDRLDSQIIATGVQLKF